MKIIKYLSLVLLILCTTGCLLGSVGKGYLTKTCTSLYETSDILKKEEITITHKDNKVVLVENKYTYEFKGNKYAFKSIKDSNESQISSLKDEDGINVEIVVDNDEQYITIYTFDINKISKLVKETYQFEEEYHIYLKNLEEKGYMCK